MQTNNTPAILILADGTTFKGNACGKIGTTTEWLLWDSSAMLGEVKAEPTREQISENIKEQLIVELYSK